ncbi:hypothetical protein BCR35DRAFT_348827 [Leucosporidium creatinivorum]|uniref:NTF2 domain-containing protein n=1 Tax=Leucosporidium creatinivorum TaxID=106004 RepID=A0A1Y2G5T6_9BASI|nr:hypothetical protein BCR35DRAFT_348827 [Leucosporidium creatinivorum]
MAAASLADSKGAEQKASELGADSTRIAWAFLSQYYSFLNKDPSRLHCFYTKRSTLIHSTEGDDVAPCYGQQEIHAKIMGLAFEDCKVYISNVDSQSSAEGGIIVQVLGEQSNRGGAWRKFSQTFFLAEQPNGYFVLNDICRYLKEEGIDEEAPAADSNEEPITVDSTLFDESSFPTPATSVLQNGVVAEASVEHEPIPEAFGEIEGDQQAAPLTNGVHHAEEPELAASSAPSEEVVAPVEPASEPQPEVQPEAPVEEVTPTVEAVPEPQPEEKKKEVASIAAEPTPAPTSAPAPAPVQAPAPAEAPASASDSAEKSKSPKVASTPAPAPVEERAPAPAAPAAPKSWASLAASNKVKWGNQAVENKGVSSAAPPPPSVVTPAERPAPPAAAAGRPLIDAVLTINSPSCFVKGVLDPVTDKALRDILTSRFGPIREFDIIRSKACAFIEFERVDSARRAIQASMRPSEGGEGGIVVVPGSMIHVVERKNPGDRPASRPRGGGAAGDDRSGGGRGAYRGSGDRASGSGAGGAQRSNAGGEEGASRGSGAGRGGSKANRGARGAGATKTANK